MTFTVSIRQTASGRWIGQVAELPAVMDQGNTREELLDNLKEGIRFYLEYLREEFSAEPDSEVLPLSVA